MAEVADFFLRTPTLTASNFKVLWLTDPKFLAIKDLNPYKKVLKFQGHIFLLLSAQVGGKSFGISAIQGRVFYYFPMKNWWKLKKTYGLYLHFLPGFYFFGYDQVLMSKIQLIPLCLNFVIFSKFVKRWALFMWDKLFACNQTQTSDVLRLAGYF